jgi:hypothetical protein
MSLQKTRTFGILGILQSGGGRRIDASFIASNDD